MKLELSDVAAGLCACRVFATARQALDGVRSSERHRMAGLQNGIFNLLKPAGAAACRYGTLPP